LEILPISFLKEETMFNKSNRGSMLILTVIVIFIVGGMVTTMLSISTSGSRRETGRDYKFKSREIAEAALDMSLNDLRKATDGLDNNGDGNIDEGNDVRDYEVPFGHFTAGEIAGLEGQLGRLGTINWTLANDANGNGFPDFGEGNVSPVNFQSGTMFAYSVFSENDGIDNDGDAAIDEVDEMGSLTIIAQARFQGITSLTMFSGIFTQDYPPPNPPLWFPNAAIASGGPFSMSGNSQVTGSAGNVHSNATITITGGPASIAGDATACGGVFGNTGQVGGTVDPAAPYADIPDIRPDTLRDSATHIFGDDGNIYDPLGNLIGSGSYQGWSFGVDATTGRPTWTLSGNTPYQGTAYMEGCDAKMTGLGSQVPQPMPLTVIAEGNIQCRGNGSYAANHQDSLLFIAGGDIALSGTQQAGSQSFQGVIAAREQISQRGTSDVNGVIMASNLDNGYDLVTGTDMGGTPLVNYEGGITPNIPVYVPTNRYVLDPSFAAYEEN
jgi:hypothetical protein